jgi:hypothetical protein
MMYCYYCGDEYPRGVTCCSHCGAMLVYRFRTNTPGGHGRDAHEFEVVRTFHNAIEANLARTTLTAAGIESVVRIEDYAGGALPHMSFIKGIQLLVRSEDLPDADEILRVDASGAVP